MTTKNNKDACVSAFTRHFNLIYGENGTYPCRDIDEVEMCMHIARLQLIKPNYTFRGNSVDTMNLRDAIFSDRDKTYMHGSMI